MRASFQVVMMVLALALGFAPGAFFYGTTTGVILSNRRRLKLAPEFLILSRVKEIQVHHCNSTKWVTALSLKFLRNRCVDYKALLANF
jgi:hypothetical protein